MVPCHRRDQFPQLAARMEMKPCDKPGPNEILATAA